MNSATGLYLVLGFFVFYIMWLRNTSALTVFEKDPCRTRRQNFQQNGTLSEVSRAASEYQLILKGWAANPDPDFYLIWMRVGNLTTPAKSRLIHRDWSSSTTIYSFFLCAEGVQVL